MKDDSIPLSETKGLNPVIPKCEWCGKDTNQILIAGSYKMFECPKCKAKALGITKCPNCDIYMKNLGEYDKYIHGPLVSGLCDKCLENQRITNEEIERGGCPWRCRDCGSTGAFKADSETSKKLREMNEGKVMGLELTKEVCPICKGDNK